MIRMEKIYRELSCAITGIILRDFYMFIFQDYKISKNKFLENVMIKIALNRSCVFSVLLRECEMYQDKHAGLILWF